MAELLKLFFDERLVRSLADELRRAHPSFRVRSFVAASLDGLDRLELTGRAAHIAGVLHGHLPRPFAAAARVLVSSLGPELPYEGSAGMAPFRYLPHVLYVAEHGRGDFEASMAAQYEITKRFTAEWSIRTFLAEYPQATLERLTTWTQDPNVHVRRLVSEGTRPRLPWAPRLRAFQQDPRPVLALLEILRDDPERYVQRSVANNLNDIAKDHPDLVVKTCRRWLRGAPEGRAWIVNHALRSLVKSGHRGALGVIGAGATPQVRVGGARINPKRVRIGDRARFEFTLTSAARATQDLIVDFAVHFVKANGATRPKVFKLRRVELPAGARLELAGSVSLARLTTRRPYPGRHAIDVLVNGVAFPLAGFDVVDS